MKFVEVTKDRETKNTFISLSFLSFASAHHHRQQLLPQQPQHALLHHRQQVLQPHPCQWRTGFADTALEWMHDVSGYSRGQRVGLSVEHVFDLGLFELIPRLGAAWLDRRYVDYYYGVRETEATFSRPAYRAGAAVNYHTGLALNTPIFFGGMTRLGLQYHWFDDSIANSPLTDRDSGASAFLAWSRFF